MLDKTSSRSSTPRKNIVIKKTTWGIGLNWEQGTTAAQTKKTAKEKAKLKSLETYVIHTARDGTFQYGLFDDKRSEKNKMPALASALVASRAGNWIAFFQLPSNQYYILASRNGAIDPLSDKIFDAQDEAYECLQTVDLGTENRYTIYAPESMRISAERSEPWSFSDATANLKPNGKLTSVDPTRVLREQAMRGILLLAVCAGLWYVYNLIANSRPAEKTVATTIPAAPWNNAESGIEQAAYCLEGFQAMPVTGPGWSRKGLVCKGGQIAAVFTRNSVLDNDGAPVQWLIDAIKSGGWPIEGFRHSDKDTNYVMQVPVSPTIWKDRDVSKKVDDFLPMLINRLDGALIEASVSAKEGTYYVSRKLTFKSKLTPAIFLHLFKDIKGMTLDSILVDDSGYTTTFLLHENGRIPAGTLIESAKPVRKFPATYQRYYSAKPIIIE